MTQPPDEQTESGQESHVIPALMIGWDEANQCVEIKFDNRQFKTWDFILGILKMAEKKAEFYRQMEFARHLKQQQEEAARVMQIKRSVGL